MRLNYCDGLDQRASRETNHQNLRTNFEARKIDTGLTKNVEFLEVPLIFLSLKFEK